MGKFACLFWGQLWFSNLFLGWQVAADANTAEDMCVIIIKTIHFHTKNYFLSFSRYPDQSLYPANLGKIIIILPH
jgi:hypothetical protein